MAVDLENLYVFMIDKLIEGNINNDPACCTHVEQLLTTLYQAWKDVIENPRADGIPSQRLQPDEYKKFVDAVELDIPKTKKMRKTTRKKRPS